MPTKSKDLRKTGPEELQGQLDEALKDLYQLRVRNVTKELSNTASIRQRRRA